MEDYSHNGIMRVRVMCVCVCVCVCVRTWGGGGDWILRIPRDSFLIDSLGLSDEAH